MGGWGGSWVTLVGASLSYSAGGPVKYGPPGGIYLIFAGDRRKVALYNAQLRVYFQELILRLSKVNRLGLLADTRPRVSELSFLYQSTF